MTAYTGQWRIDAKTTSYQTTAVVSASSVAAGDTLDLQLVDPSGLFQINDAASMVVAFPGFTNKGGMQWEDGQGATGSVLARHVTVGDWYRFHMNAVPSSAGGMWWAGNVTLSKTTAPAGPTLNNAAGVYAGSVSAVAVYAGDVKVWPLGPPEPDGTAHWDATGFELKLVVDEINGYQQGRYVIAVPLLPGPVPHPTNTLGQGGTATTSRMWWGSASSSPVIVQMQITNADAVAEWGGHLVAFTVNNSRTVTAVEVVAPLPPPSADRTASWAMVPVGVLQLKIDGGSNFPPESTTLTVAVPQFTGNLPGTGNNLLGTGAIGGAARIYWTHSSIGDIELPLNAGAYGTDRITNDLAISQWGGHTLRLTFPADLGVSLVEVIG